MNPHALETTAGGSGKVGRRLALEVHAAVRAMILTGELPPGSPIPQAVLARTLRVSRTPMREAFRLLQEEGLIEYRPDQRAVVRRVDPAEIDAVYTSRIMVEAVAVSMTVRRADPELVAAMEVALARMRRHGADEEIEEWHHAHREFHDLTTGRASALQESICGLRERGERFLHLSQRGSPGTWDRWDADHRSLVEAFRIGDHDRAVVTIAQHLARTALTAMTDIAPEHEPAATRAALQLLSSLS